MTARLLPDATHRMSQSGFVYGVWALPRPLTRHWGQGRELLERMNRAGWSPDVVFGKQDFIPDHVTSIDKDPDTHPTHIANWADLPFADDSFRTGYWDPPYLGYIGPDGDVHYDRLDASYREIGRVVSDRLVILSPLIYPALRGWRREAIIAITYGPNKIIRALQVFYAETLYQSVFTTGPGD